MKLKPILNSFLLVLVFSTILTMPIDAKPDGASRLELIWRHSGEDSAANGIPEHKNNVYGLALSPDGRILVDTGRDGRIIERDPANGKPFRELTPNEESVYSVGWKPDGRIFATAGIDGEIRLWTPDGRLIKTLHGHTSTVRRMAWSPDGDRLASASWDRSLRIWDPVRGIQTLRIPHANGVNTLAYRPDGAVIATGSSGKSVQFWNPTTGESYGEMDVGSDIDSLTWSPEADKFAIGDFDGAVGVWLSEKGGSLNGPLNRRAFHTVVRALMYTPNGKNLVSIGQDGLVRLWDSSASEVRDVENPKGLYAFSLTMNADGSRIFVGCADGTIAAYRLK
jgi:WD40 repeat protein